MSIEMKFKKGDKIEINFDSDFIISRKIHYGSFFFLETCTDLILAPGKYIGLIEGSSHGSFQGLYRVRFQIGENLFMCTDLNEKNLKKCRHSS